jgi:hypothetical protein
MVSPRWLYNIRHAGLDPPSHSFGATGPASSSLSGFITPTCQAEASAKVDSPVKPGNDDSLVTSFRLSMVLEGGRMIHMVSICLFFVFTSMASANESIMRCGTNLVSKGDKTFEVKKKCGEPIAKESVGFTLKGDRRELEIKEWIYGPQNGVYYYLTFHGTDLVNVESRRDTE